VSGDENKALLRRFFEASDQGDPETIVELHAPHFADHSLNPGQARDREGYLRPLSGIMPPYLTAAPPSPIWASFGVGGTRVPLEASGV
jgi:hypothetical protein